MEMLNGTNTMENSVAISKKTNQQTILFQQRRGQFCGTEG